MHLATNPVTTLTACFVQLGAQREDYELKLQDLQQARRKAHFHPLSLIASHVCFTPRMIASRVNFNC
jgi:hypothetical protein